MIIRSGYAPYFAATGEPPKFGSPSGVHASCIEFLADTEAGLLAWDLQDAPNADQGLTPIIPGVDIALHVHHIVLPYMGMPIVDNCELEDAASDLRRARAVGVPVRRRAARDHTRHRARR